MFAELYENLKRRSASWANETELRHGWLTSLSKNLGIEFHLERGRRDSSLNNVVIEFKDYGLFRGRTSSPPFREAIDERLLPYILRISSEQGMDQSDYIGIAIDGKHICFAQVTGNKISHGPLLEFSPSSVAMVAMACKDAYRRAVTAENLIEDFGHNSACGSSLMQAFAVALSNSISQPSNNKIKMLFEEWKALYGQVADLSIEQVAAISRTLNFEVVVEERLKIPASLFVIHSYNSLIIKLLAAEIVSVHKLTSYENFAQQCLNIDDTQLLNRINNDIERGLFFSRVGIRGFIEEAIFSWYIDACDDINISQNIVGALREVIVKLALYRTDKLTTARSSDILKRFYQDLVPEVLRKSLGEFYTPDWLVDVTVDKVEPVDWLEIRALDPTCGSGSFVLEAIRRKRAAAEAVGMSPEDIIHHLTSTVWGFDLNPLAVQSARVNLLMAIADLLKAAPGEQIELPILLADAIYSPARDPHDDEDCVRYVIGSHTADLEVVLPSALALNRDRLDAAFEVMGSVVEQNKDYAECAQELISRKALTSEESRAWGESLELTYNRVLVLHRNNWNGIWFRIVRNFFWSATAGQFDVVIGNPPWVRWSKLPELYRERVKSTCLQYEIFSSTPHHGGNELDISGMITYTVADKWLRTGGKLAFVITQTHFQSPSSEGFRNFKINEQDRIIPISVDDLKSLKPFADAANKTAIALFSKQAGAVATYPVPYVQWEPAKGFTRTLPVNSTKQEIYDRVTLTELEANPVSGSTSPWAILRPGRFQEISRFSGKCPWVQGRKGITADLNGIYFVEVLEINQRRGLVKIATRPEAGKRDIGVSQEFWIESTLLYPLIKGASDFEACRLTRKHQLFAIVPNQGIVREAYKEAEARINGDLPQTRRYFESYRNLLQSRSTYRLRMSAAPYYSVYNVGDYTFAAWKVIWAEQGTFAAAVVNSSEVPLQDRKPFVPDHKIFFADFNNPEPAYYLCGLLNSSIVKEYVESHNISIQIGDIFKHMTLPEFNPQDPLHLLLIEHCRACHNATTDSEYSENIKQVIATADNIISIHLSCCVTSR